MSITKRENKVEQINSERKYARSFRLIGNALGSFEGVFLFAEASMQGGNPGTGFGKNGRQEK